MASYSHSHSSNAPSDRSSSNPESNGNPFDAFDTQSRSNHGNPDHHSGSSNSNDFTHDFVSVHGSHLSGDSYPSSSQRSSNRSSESDPITNSHMSTTFATANTNSIPLHQPSGSGNSYSSHSATSMNNSYHRPESLSMLHHNPMYEHNSTFTSSNQASNHNSIPSRIVTSQHRHDYHDTLLEKIASTQKTMEQLAISNQNLMQRQSEMLMRIFEDQAASAATQTNLLHKQTLILQTMHAPVTKRVPASHFMPNPSDGISFDASSNQPSLAQTDQQDDDDAQSVQSTNHFRCYSQS